jgi:hypothetical protein
MCLPQTRGASSNPRPAPESSEVVRQVAASGVAWESFRRRNLVCRGPQNDQPVISSSTAIVQWPSRVSARTRGRPVAGDGPDR